MVSEGDGVFEIDLLIRIGDIGLFKPFSWVVTGTNEVMAENISDESGDVYTSLTSARTAKTLGHRRDSANIPQHLRVLTRLVVASMLMVVNFQGTKKKPHDRRENITSAAHSG